MPVAVRLEQRYTREAPDQREGRLVLRGEREWLLRGEPAAVAEIVEALPGIAEPLGGDTAFLGFGNAVGTFDLPILGRVEVVSGKWRQADHEHMLAELTEIAAALPFSATGAAALPYDRSVASRDDVVYHAFAYLRYILSDSPPPDRRLLPALRLILRDPHRRWRRTRVERSQEAVRSVDAGMLMELVTGRGNLQRAESSEWQESALARALHGYVPARLAEEHVEPEVDTAENRFVKAFLGQAEGVIEQVRSVFRSVQPSAVHQRVLRECDWMSRSLQPITRDPLWHRVGEMTHLPAASTVLQRKRGYREVFRHFSRLRLSAHIPLDKNESRDLLESKDIALLYELWCFFQCVAATTVKLGRASEADRPAARPHELMVPWDFRVRWRNGTALYYNTRFSRSHREQRRSYSVPLRPDIVMEVPGGINAGLHLFDAKFRVSRRDRLVTGKSREVGERHGSFKRSDLYKMHAYRDAIPLACFRVGSISRSRLPVLRIEQREG